MNVAEDDYKLLTQDEIKKLFGMLDKIYSMLESPPKSTEETLPATNESSQAKNDLPERIEQQVENFNSSVKGAYNLSNLIGKQIKEFNTATENSLKSINDKIQELNCATENFSKTVTTISELQQTLDQFMAKKNPWQEMFDKFATNVQTFKETTEHQNTAELEQLKNQLDDFKSKLGAVQADKQRLESESRTKTAELDDKRRTLEAVQADKQRLETELRTKTAELDDKRRILEAVQADKQRLEGELRTKNAELDDKRRTLEDIQADKQRLEGELRTKNAELDDKRHELKSIQESVQSVKNIFNVYEPVLAALKNCPLFSKYVNEHDLTAGDSKALFRLARTMGETSDFASEIHSIAVEAKKNSKEPLTASEGTVYKAISRCYAEIWNIDFDIFICPGEQSTDKPYTTTNFNRSDMINLLDPRDKVSKYAQEVYVPLLRTKNRGLISQAHVKAGNDMK